MSGRISNPFPPAPRVFKHPLPKKKKKRRERDSDRLPLLANFFYYSFFPFLTAQFGGVQSLSESLGPEVVFPSPAKHVQLFSNLLLPGDWLPNQAKENDPTVSVIRLRHRNWKQYQFDSVFS